MPAGKMKTHLNSFLLVYIISLNNATVPIEFIINPVAGTARPAASVKKIKRN